jgi:hypothetical protein
MDIEPFVISVPDAATNDLIVRLERVRWPDQLEGITWEQGTDRTYLESAHSSGGCVRCSATAGMRVEHNLGPYSPYFSRPEITSKVLNQDNMIYNHRAKRAQFCVSLGHAVSTEANNGIRSDPARLRIDA